MTAARLRPFGGVYSATAQDVVNDSGQGTDRAQNAALAGVLARLAASERQRRHRERVRDGKIVLSIEVDGLVIEALLSTGAISEAESLSRHAIEAALGEMVDEWTQRALKSVTP